MQNLNEFTKEQLELLIATISHTTFSISNSDNLALDIVEYGHAFDFFGFDSPVNNRSLAIEPSEYMSDIIAPVLNPIINHYEARFGVRVCT